MTNRLFVGIAVQKPDDMTPLPGVWTALKKVSRFVNAATRHDAPILITDEDGPVTIQRVKNALKKRVLLERPRITVYFCGHGAYIDGTEVWYLSHGRKNGRNNGEEQINVMAFRDVLATYGPAQISFFSDACQTVDTMSGAARQVLDPHKSAFFQPQYDIFRATIRGEAAYASKADGPLFSKVMSEVLNTSPPEEAMVAIDGAGPHVRGVSSQSLAKYMHYNMPDYAAVEGVQQQPELLPALFLDNDYIIVSRERPYESGAGGGKGGGKGRGKGGGGDADWRPDENSVVDTINSISSEWRGPFWDRAISDAASNRRKPVLEAYLFGGAKTNLVRNRLHLANGIAKQGIAVADDRLSYDLRDADGVRAGVLNVDDIYVPVSLAISDILNLVSNISFPFEGNEKKPSDGVHLLGWYMMYNPRRQGRLDPWKVLQGLMTGAVNASAIPTLAKDLRFEKHSDPIFGIVAAYLYDRVGDVNSIRRLCAYYDIHGQAVPFDIALLARAPFEVADGGGYKITLPDIPEDVSAKDTGLPAFVWNAMQGRTVTVSGVVPVLTAGWGRLKSLSRDPRIIEFATFREFLQDTPIACFRGHELGKDLIDMMLDIYQG